MLHAWEKYGLKNAEREFRNKYERKNRRFFKEGEGNLFKQIVKGRINFLKMVKGGEDPTYIRSCSHLAKLDADFNMAFQDRMDRQNILNAIFVLECERDIKQGTAFMLKDVGFVTCHHVFGSETRAFKYNKFNEKYPVSKIISNETIDISIFGSDIPVKSELKVGNVSKIQKGCKIKIIGFPNYSLGQSHHTYEGAVVGSKVLHGVRRIYVDCFLYIGMSGAPVLNDKDEVVGIAVSGAQTTDKAHRTENSFIPIEAISLLTKKI